MAMRIGCDNLVYALMTTEDTAITPPVYGSVTAAPGVMSININPNASLATAFFDDGPGDTAATLGNIDVEIQKNALTAQNKADLLGHVLDTNGAVAYSGEDTPPWVAIGFRTLKSNGKYRYVWLYKGRFADPEDNSETKADSINFQSDTITGQFVKFAYPLTIGGLSRRTWKYELDADNTNADENAMAAWFDAVLLPGSGGNIPPTISATWAPGVADDSTSATLPAAGSGNSYAYKISESTIPTPTVGMIAAGTTAYTSEADIPAVSENNYVAIYELSALGAVVKFVLKQLEAADINPGT